MDMATFFCFDDAKKKRVERKLCLHIGFFFAVENRKNSFAQNQETPGETSEPCI